jgi:hypothetical protein
MKNMKLEGTQTLPEVLLDFESGELSISGKSYPERPLDFYSELGVSLIEVQAKSLDITISLEYVNTSSSKCLINLLKDIQKRFPESKVTWMVEEDDEDTEELGKIFEESLDMPFQFFTMV